MACCVLPPVAHAALGIGLCVVLAHGRGAERRAKLQAGGAGGLVPSPAGRWRWWSSAAARRAESRSHGGPGCGSPPSAHPSSTGIRRLFLASGHIGRWPAATREFRREEGAAAGTTHQSSQVPVWAVWASDRPAGGGRERRGRLTIVYGPE